MILGTICARGGSKGIPGKNNKHLHGQRLIGYTIELAKKYPFDKLIVSTDSEEIADYARAWHVEVQIRPPHLATDESSKWDVFRYLAETNPCETLVDLDTGCPFRNYQDISRTIQKLKDYDVVFTAYESERNPYFNMVEEFPTWGIYHVVCDDKAITRRQDAPKVYSLSPSVVAIKREVLFKVNHWSESLLGILEVPRSRGFDIDTMDDWNYAEWRMRNDRY